MFASGAGLTAAGLAWNWVFPINKNLWTSSYVVFSAGVAMLVLATASWLIEIRRVRGWTRPLVTYGQNPLAAFLGSGAMARTLGLLQAHGTAGSVSVKEAIFERGFASWLAPIDASLLFAVSFVLVWYLILLVFERRGWILKI